MRALFLVSSVFFFTSCSSQIEEPNIIETRPGRGGVARQNAQTLLLNSYVSVINATARNVIFLTSRAYETEKASFPTEGIRNLKLYGTNGENGFEWEYRTDPAQDEPTYLVKVVITQNKIEYVKKSISQTRDILTLSDLRLYDNRLTGTLSFESSRNFKNLFYLNETSFVIEFDTSESSTQIASFESMRFYMNFAEDLNEEDHFLKLREGLNFLLSENCRNPQFASTKVELKMPYSKNAVIGDLDHKGGRLKLNYKRIYGSQSAPSCEG